MTLRVFKVKFDENDENRVSDAIGYPAYYQDSIEADPPVTPLSLDEKISNYVRGCFQALLNNKEQELPISQEPGYNTIQLQGEIGENE